jgi:hypothetical protein
MPTFEVVAELLVVGLFVLVALTPLVGVIAPALERSDGAGLLPVQFPGEKKVGAAFVLAVACYATGVVANVLIDETANRIADFSGDERDAVEAKLKLEKRPGAVKTFKAAEHALRERSEAVRDWLDVRRSYIRIERGLAASCLLFLAATGVAVLLRRRDKKAGAKSEWKRVGRSVVVAFVLLVLATLAWRAQETKYAEYVGRLTLELPRN